MSPVLIERIFKRQCVLSSFGECELAACGSILQWIQAIKKVRPVFVWGSGYIEPGKTLKDPCFHYYLVRGEVTKKRLGITSVATGDPGLLASIAFPALPTTSKIGVVPHYIDAGHQLVKKMKKDARFLIINPLDDVEVVCKQISSCKCILSSSLHGLIVADSYLVPNIHLMLSDKLTGGTYKFRDYYSGVGKKYHQLKNADVFDDKTIEQIIKEYQPITNLKRVQTKIIKSFPFTKANVMKRVLHLTKKP